MKRHRQGQLGISQIHSDHGAGILRLLIVPGSPDENPAPGDGGADRTKGEPPTTGDTPTIVERRQSPLGALVSKVF